jgi:kynurenine formamidase
MNGSTNDLSNWGRWGRDDQKGTLNFITSDEIISAAGLVKEGKVYSLSMPLDTDGPQWPNRHKTWQTTTLLDVGDGAGFSDDILTMYSHSGTHMDSLCHLWVDHQLYNGFDVREHVTSFGSTRNSIDNVPAIVGRGILLDIAGWKGVHHLKLGEAISALDLDQCAASQNVVVNPGDIVLVNTGWMNIFEQDRALFDSGEPGLDMSTIEWLHEHDISAIGADNHGVEVMASIPPEGLPFHFAAIRDLGLYLLENLKLQPLADDKQFEFLFVAAPLQLTAAVGSSINPLAVV